MRVTTLASGSKGNCTYVEGASGALLIDAGLSARDITTRLTAAGGRLDLIRAILVTHEHVDHVRGAVPLARKLHVPIIASGGTLSEVLRCRGSRPGLSTTLCKTSELYHVEEFTIRPFSTSHDALEPYGFCVSDGKARFGCCTDTGMLTPEMIEQLRICDMVMLESNHCPNMLAGGPYPPALKRRIRSKRGHLSNQAAAEGVRALGRDVPIIELSHLSEINNTPAKARASARGGLGLFADEVDLIIALQHEISPTRLF